MWTKTKPVIDREMIILTASKWKSKTTDKETWDMEAWLIAKVDREDGWYYGLCDLDGEEWGTYDELNAELYYIIELPEKK